jgi:hypothetical protein
MTRQLVRLIDVLRRMNDREKQLKEEMRQAAKNYKYGVYDYGK